MVRLLISILGDMGCNIETTTAASDERKGVLRTEDRHAVQQVNSCGTLISDVAAYIYFFL